MINELINDNIDTGKRLAYMRGVIEEMRKTATHSGITREWLKILEMNLDICESNVLSDITKLTKLNQNKTEERK